MKKIALIGIAGLPAKYGGFESFAEQLVQRLWDHFDFTVYCSKTKFTEYPDSFGKAHLKWLPIKANGIQSIFFDMTAILSALHFADTLLILGVSGCSILPLLRLFGCRKKIVVNIDGIEWKRAKWSRLIHWGLHFSEWCAVRYSDIVIGDNQIIVDYVKKVYRRNCELIEYGGDNRKFEEQP